MRAAGTACAGCLRRAWLLSELGPLLDYHRNRRERLWALLALEDRQLIEALAGRRRGALLAEHARWRAPREPRGQLRVCRHDPGFPAALRHEGAPAILHLTGEHAQATVAGGPAVALLGSGAPGDYGLAMAAELAAGLAASGVTVLAAPEHRLGRAALEAAARRAEGRAVAVCGDGAGAGAAEVRRAVLAAGGTAVSELPPGCGGRRWGAPAAERTLVGLATVSVMVQAPAGEEMLAAAARARGLGRELTAVPGNVTNPLAAAPNELLARGASIVRDAGELLDLLHLPRPPAYRPSPRLEGRLQQALDAVGAGVDTAEGLLAAGLSLRDAQAALGELEALGLVGRTSGGRWVARAPAGSAPCAL